MQVSEGFTDGQTIRFSRGGNLCYLGVRSDTALCSVVTCFLFGNNVVNKRLGRWAMVFSHYSASAEVEIIKDHAEVDERCQQAKVLVYLLTFLT